MSGNRSVILGLFFLVTLAILGYYTLFLTDFTLFKNRPEMTVHFAETNGLREGDGVLVAGMRWGRIKKLTLDPTAPIEKRVTVLASLDAELPLREGFKIQIKDAIQTLFKVGVIDVNTMVMRGKDKRMGRGYAKLHNWKKAIVTLKAGDEIQFFDEKAE